MSKWKMISFEDVFDDCTKYGRKIMKEDYLECGKYPIVDQGQNRIAGYANDDLGIFEDVPAIIFGDHTRIIKYIDEPFFLGADGVKLLKAKEKGTNYKYLFYSLLSAHIPDTGYNRHFKWLKDLQILLPPLEEQKRIADILDKASNLIDLRKQQLEKMDLLIKSKFIDMFGNPVTNPKGWEKCEWKKVFNTATGKLDSNAMNENGKYPFFTCSKEVHFIDTYAFDQEALLLAGNNATANYDVKYYSGKFNAYQRTYILTLKECNNQYCFFKILLEQKLQHLQQQSKGSNTKYLTMGILDKLDFILPPTSLQNQFAAFVEQVEKQKAVMQQSLEKMETNYKALMQEYFG